METVKICKRLVNKKDGGTFPKLIAIYQNEDGVDNFLDVNFSNECRQNFDAEMIVKKLSFPVQLDADFQARDYFIVQEEYTNKEGNQAFNNKMVITNYSNLREVERTQHGDSKSLKDIFG